MRELSYRSNKLTCVFLILCLLMCGSAQNANGGTVYKRMLTNTFYKLERKFQNRADWEKSIKEAKVRIGL